MVPIQIISSHAESHYLDVKNILLHHIKRVLDDNGIQKRPRGQATYWLRCSPALIVLLQTFYINPDKNLRQIIVEPADDLDSFIVTLYVNNISFIDDQSDDYKILYNIFISNGYENPKFDKSKFVSRIGIDTCPYCNRNYIYTSKKNRKVKPEIDHFYPKNLYPLLGLSFFNLIPSCETCNGQGCKHKNDPMSQRLINPYLIKQDDFTFTHSIDNISIINPLVGKSAVKIRLMTNCENNLKIFNLKDLYDLHHDHALELIVKQRIKYSKKYRDYLRTYQGLKFNPAEIDRMILGNYSLEKDQHKRPLAKMYQDIGKELGLIK